MITRQQSFLQANMIMVPPGRASKWVFWWILLALDVWNYIDMGLIEALTKANEESLAVNKEQPDLLTKQHWLYSVLQAFDSLNPVGWFFNFSFVGMVCIAVLFALIIVFINLCSLGFGASHIYGLKAVSRSYLSAGYQNFLLYFVKLINYYPEALFTLTLLFFARATSCKFAEITVQSTLSSSLTLSPEDSIDRLNGFRIHETNAIAKVSLINMNTLCGSGSHVALIIIFAVTCISAAAQVVISQKFLSSWPDPWIPNSRIRLSAILDIFLVSVLYLVKIILNYVQDSNPVTQLSTFWMVCLVQVLLFLAIQTYAPGNIARSENVWQLRRFLILLFIRNVLASTSNTIISFPAGKYLCFATSLLVSILLGWLLEIITSNKIFQYETYDDCHLLETAHVLLSHLASSASWGGSKQADSVIIDTEYVPETIMDISVHFRRLEGWVGDINKYCSMQSSVTSELILKPQDEPLIQKQGEANPQSTPAVIKKTINRQGTNVMQDNRDLVNLLKSGHLIDEFATLAAMPISIKGRADTKLSTDKKQALLERKSSKLDVTNTRFSKTAKKEQTVIHQEYKFEDIPKMLAKVLFSQLLKQASAASSKRMTMFPRLINMFTSVMLFYRKDIFRTVHLLKIVKNRMKHGDYADKTTTDAMFELSNQMILLAYEFEDDEFRNSELDQAQNRCNQQTRARYGPILDYIDTFKETTIKIEEVLKLRKAFVDDVLSEDSNHPRAYERASRFTSINQEIQKGFTKLKMLSSDANTQLGIVKYNYAIHILQEEFRAGKKLKDILKRRFNSNFMRLEINLDLREEEISVITCSLEQSSLQEINLLSGNLGKMLEYNASDLKGKLITVMIPEPIKSVHHMICGPATATARLIKSADWYPLPMIRKCGFLRPLPLKVLVYFDLQAGLQGVLLIKHKVNNFEENLVLIDSKGMVTGTDEAVSYIIKQNHQMSEFNENLGKALQTAQLAEDHLLNAGVPSMTELAAEKALAESYKQLLALRQGKAFMIHGIDSDIEIAAQVKLSSHYHKETKVILRSLRFEWRQDKPNLGELSSYTSVDFSTALQIEGLMPGEAEAIKYLKLLQDGLYNMMVEQQGICMISFSPKKNGKKKSSMEGGEQLLNNLRYKLENNLNAGFETETNDNHLRAKQNEKLDNNTIGSVVESGYEFGHVRTEILHQMFRERILKANINTSIESIAIRASGVAVWILILAHVILHLANHINYSVARQDFNSELPALNNLMLAVSVNVEQSDFALIGQELRAGKLPQTLMAQFFPNETASQTIQVAKLMTYVPLVMQVQSYISKILNTTHSWYKHSVDPLLWGKTFSSDSEKEANDDYHTGDFNFLEYLTYYEPLLARFVQTPETDLPAEQDAERNEVVNTVYHIQRGHVNYQLDLIVSSFNAHLRSRVMSTQRTVELLIYVSLALLLLIGVVIFTTSWIIGRQLSQFFARYFFLRKSDVVLYQRKLYAMDGFWRRILSDQWRVHRTGQAIYRELISSTADLEDLIVPTAKPVPHSEDSIHKQPALNSLGTIKTSLEGGVREVVKLHLEPRKKKISSSITKRNERVKYSVSKSPSASTLMILASFCLITIPMAIVTGIDGSRMLTHSKQVGNLVDVYVNTIELVSATYHQFSTLLTMTLRPNETTYGTKPIEEVFLANNNKIVDEVAGKFEEFLKMDLSTFEPDYKVIATKMTMCEMNFAIDNQTVDSRFIVFEPSCGFGSTDIFNNTLPVYIRKLAASFTSIYFQLKTLAPADRHQMASDLRWSSLIKYQINNSVIGAVYYLLLLALSPALADLLKFDGPEPGLVLGSARDKLFFSLQIMLLAVGAVILLTAVVAPAERTLRIFRNTCLLLPWRLALQNPLLSHHFRR